MPVSARTIEYEGNRAIVRAAMPIELTAEKRALIAAKNGLLSLTLAEAVKDGGMLQSEPSVRGLYLSRDQTGEIEELYRYEGSVGIRADRAVIEYTFPDHPQWLALHAEIRENGNAGSIAITTKETGVLRDSW
jgi:hypothetical protein